MSDGNGGSDRLGFKIPESVKKTIKDIREITGKQHSDEDIYSVLRDCSMDPNETAQKLLYLDTFQEFKKKSNRRKVTASTQGRGQSGRGYNSRNNNLKPRENGVNQMKERGNNSSFRAGQKMNNGVSSTTNAASGTPSSNFPNGASSSRHGSNLTAIAVNQIDDKKKSSNQNHPPPTSSSNPILAPSNVWNHGSVGSIKCVLGSERKATEQSDGNKHVNGDLDSDLSGNKQSLSRNVKSVMKEKDPNSVASEKYHASDSIELSSLSAHIDSLNISSSNNATCHAEETSLLVKELSPEDAKKAKACAQLLPQSTFPSGHVIFPDHLKVPEAIKNGFTFGSFNSNGCDTPTPAAEKNETATEPLSSDQNLLLSVQVTNSDQSISPRQLNSKNSELVANEISDANVNQLNKESALLPDAKENSVVSVAPNCGSEMKPPAQNNQIMQLEVQETEAQNTSSLSSVAGDKLMTSSQTPMVQNPVAASPHPLLFMPPYHPNFLPYAHYYSPYFMSQFHPFLSPNGLPQQLSTGAFLPQAPNTSGFKFPLPQFKPATNGVNPSLYGSYGLPSVGLNSGPALTLGSNTNNDDISASQQKESEVYTTGAMNDVPAWIPPGHEMSGLQLNSYYHLPPQGQHLGFSHAQTSHTPFPGIYPSVQTMNAPTTANPIMQQSQSMSVETVGPPASAAFHQLQISQTSWSANY